jgi:hypothetical protein
MIAVGLSGKQAHRDAVHLRPPDPAEPRFPVLDGGHTATHRLRASMRKWCKT